MKFGFKEQPNIEPIIYKIRQELADKDQVSLLSAFKSINQNKIPADFKYVFLNTRLSSFENLTFLDYASILVYRTINSTGISIIADYGIDNSKTVSEVIPVQFPVSKNSYSK
jgi:hypothetical protein